MSFRKRMQDKRAGLKNRHKEQIDNKDGNTRFPTVIMKDQLPAGIETWYCKEGQHLVDIIPWEAGPDMPLGKNSTPITEEGDLEYILDIMVHTNVGKMKVPYVCPYENFGDPCPICEYIKSHELDKETWKELKPGRRAFYLVWVHDTRDTESKGVMLWEVAHFFMEAKLVEIAHNPTTGGAIAFSDYESGKSIAWTRKGTKNTEFLGHRFIDRAQPLPEKILEMGFPIDQVIDMHPEYEIIEAAFKDTIEMLSEGIQRNDSAGSNFADDKESAPMWQDDYSDEPEEKKTGKRILGKKTLGKKIEKIEKTDKKGSGTKILKKKTTGKIFKRTK